MVLIFEQIRETLPLTIINVHDGKPLLNVAYQGDLNNLEFLEQLNEHLLIKPIEKRLKLHNTVTSQNTYIESFETPEAFVFIYEKEMFFCINKGQIQQYNAQDGTLISDFGMKQVYTKSKRLAATEEEDDCELGSYVIHLAEKRNYLFTVVDETMALPQSCPTLYRINRKRA